MTHSCTRPALEETQRVPRAQLALRCFRTASGPCRAPGPATTTGQAALGRPPRRACCRAVRPAVLVSQSASFGFSSWPHCTGGSSPRLGVEAASGTSALMRTAALLIALLGAAWTLLLSDAHPYTAVRKRPRPLAGPPLPARGAGAGTRPRPRPSAAAVKEFDASFDAGRRAMRANNIEEALKHFQHATSIGPQSSGAHANIGICFLRLGKLEDAVSAFALSHTYDPHQTIAILKQAQLLHELGRTSEAAALFRRLMQVDPTDPWPYYHLAEYAADAQHPRDVELRQRRYAECAQRFKVKLETDRSLLEEQRGNLLEIMGRCLAKVDRDEEANSAFDAAAEAGNSFALITKADNLGAQDRMLEAAEAYEAALEIRGPTLATHLALGGTYFAVAKPFAVLDSNSQAAKRMATLTHEDKMGFLEKAVKQFDAALGFEPQNGKAIWSKGKALLALGRLEDAQATFQAGADAGAWPNKWQHLPPTNISGIPRFDPTIRSRPNWTGDPVVATAVRRLQDNFDVIVAELKQSLPDYNPSLSAEHSTTLWSNKNSADLVDRGNWMMLYMLRKGRRDNGCDFMPRTCQLLEGLARQGHLGTSRHAVDTSIQAQGESHTIFFSGLRGDTHVTAHCGPHNRRMRILFPVIIPAGGNYSMRLTDEMLDYTPGRPIVFDDSYEHEVWATAPPGSDEPRVLLIIDIVHPDLR